MQTLFFPKYFNPRLVESGHGSCGYGGPLIFLINISGFHLHLFRNLTEVHIEEWTSIYPILTNSKQRDEKGFVPILVIGVVGSLNSEAKIGLTNPQCMTEIIKTGCHLNLVKDYMSFRKYYLQEVEKTTKDPSLLLPKPDGKSNQDDPKEGNKSNRWCQRILRRSLGDKTKI